PVINDLNLEVSGPAGLYLGDVFSLGQSVTGGVADLKNSVEMVLLNAPAPGAYTVRVRGAAVNQGLQGYALAATGDLVTGGAPWWKVLSGGVGGRREVGDGGQVRAGAGGEGADPAGVGEVGRTLLEGQEKVARAEPVGGDPVLGKGGGLAEGPG